LITRRVAGDRKSFAGISHRPNGRRRRSAITGPVRQSSHEHCCARIARSSRVGGRGNDGNVDLTVRGMRRHVARTTYEATQGLTATERALNFPRACPFSLPPPSTRPLEGDLRGRQSMKTAKRRDRRAAVPSGPGSRVSQVQAQGGGGRTHSTAGPAATVSSIVSDRASRKITEEEKGARVDSRLREGKKSGFHGPQETSRPSFEIREQHPERRRRCGAAKRNCRGAEKSRVAGKRDQGGAPDKVGRPHNAQDPTRGAFGSTRSGRTRGAGGTPRPNPWIKARAGGRHHEGDGSISAAVVQAEGNRHMGEERPR